jgi:hypothetical protein
VIRRNINVPVLIIQKPSDQFVLIELMQKLCLSHSSLISFRIDNNCEQLFKNQKTFLSAITKQKLVTENLQYCPSLILRQPQSRKIESEHVDDSSSV